MALPIPIILCQVCEAPIEGPEGFETNPASPANCLNAPSHWFAILLPVSNQAARTPTLGRYHSTRALVLVLPHGHVNGLGCSCKKQPS
eukprot:COSAG06_NODE_1437_length_9464_cov_98.879445_7_plen_88_part_00